MKGLRSSMSEWVVSLEDILQSRGRWPNSLDFQLPGRSLRRSCEVFMTSWQGKMSLMLENSRNVETTRQSFF